MQQNIFNKIKSIFFNYTDKFREKEGEFSPMILLKYEHSIRVSKNAREIAEENQWEGTDLSIAELAGLYHDIGRFEQYRQYKSFYDPDSINHGDFGARLVKENKDFDAIPSEIKNQLIKCIKYHNKKTLPCSLNKSNQRLINLIRDADKLDIYFVVNDAIVNNKLDKFPELIWNLDIDGPPNPVIIKDILNGRLSSFSNVKTLADFNLLQLTWIHDINYNATYKKMIERRVLKNNRL